jgi:O-glycosyl hydrolase
MPAKFIVSLIVLYSAINMYVYAQYEVKIDTSIKYQTIRGFGASDAWSNDVLNLMNESDRGQTADWLFSRDQLNDSSYKGIGLSIWRYNLGAGSSEQGDSSYIDDPYRRTQSIIDADGKINIEKQAGTWWMVNEAEKKGIETLIMFSNSPPVYLTKNNKAFSSECGKSNLDSSNYKAFARYISSSLQLSDSEGIHFDYVSPVNEPEWGWCRKDGQEGCSYTNAQIAGLARELNDELARKKITAKIQIPESGLLIFANNGFRFKPGRQHQAKDFFKPGRENYIGNEPLLARQIAAHSYFTEWPPLVMKSVRRKTARTTERYGLEFWMTEYCILRGTKEIEGGGRDQGMHTALYVSRVIHHDLVYGNASSWCWWLGLSTADFKDGLVYVNRDGSGLTDSKTMWAMGNFSQFLRPGVIRVDTDCNYDKEMLVSAYIDRKAGNLIIVIINMKDSDELIRFKNIPAGRFTIWETSENVSLSKKTENTGSHQHKASHESISTLIMHY